MARKPTECHQEEPDERPDGLPIPFHEFIRAESAKRGGAPLSFRGLHGDPCGDICRSFRLRHSHISCAGQNPLYALPESLIEAIEEERRLRNWLSKDELAFERGLAAFCHSTGAAGIVDDTLVNGNMLQTASLPGPSREEFDQLALGDVMNFEQTDEAISAAAGLIDPLREACQSYLGWMTTHPPFLAELAGIRRCREARTTWRSFETAPGEMPDPKLRQFLDRWQLHSLASWDLPIAMGANLTGVTLPGRAGIPSVVTEMPVTVGLRTRYPLREITEELRRQQTPQHLREWVEISQRSAKGINLGSIQFRHIFFLHFFWDVVLASRYADRLSGNFELLDAAFGTFLSISGDAIKKLRTAIRRRLTEPPRPSQT